MKLREQPHARRRASAAAFDRVLTAISLYDAAFFYYAQWLATSGKEVRNAGRGMRAGTDWPSALAMYQRLLSEFGVGVGLLR